MLYLSTSGFAISGGCYFEFSKRYDDPSAAFRFGIDLFAGFVESVYDIHHIRGAFPCNRILCDPCCPVVRLLQTADMYCRGISSPDDGLSARTIYENVHCLCDYLHPDGRDCASTGIPLQYRRRPCFARADENLSLQSRKMRKSFMFHVKQKKNGVYSNKKLQ